MSTEIFALIRVWEKISEILLLGVLRRRLLAYACLHSYSPSLLLTYFYHLINFFPISLIKSYLFTAMKKIELCDSSMLAFAIEAFFFSLDDGVFAYFSHAQARIMHKSSCDCCDHRIS